MPTVSVIIPTYNAENHILDTINSVQGQTFRDIEIIVVDDGSTDNTAKLLKPLADSQKIRYEYQSNNGVASTRNHGLKLSRGEYIALLDADDQFKPSKLEKQVKYLKAHPEAGMCHTDYQVVDQDGNHLGFRETSFYQGYVYPQLMLNWHGPAAPSTWLIRKDTFNKIGNFDEAFINSSDTFNWLTRFARYYSFHRVPEVLMVRKIHSANISNDIDYFLEGWKQHFRIAFENDKSLNKIFQHRVLARMYGNTALMLIKNPEKRMQKRMWQYSINAIKYWPLETQGYLGLIATIVKNPLQRWGLKIWHRIKYQHPKN